MDDPPLPLHIMLWGDKKKYVYKKERSRFNKIFFLMSEVVSRYRNTIYASGSQFEKDNEMQ